MKGQTLRQAQDNVWRGCLKRSLPRRDPGATLKLVLGVSCVSRHGQTSLAVAPLIRSIARIAEFSRTPLLRQHEWVESRSSSETDGETRHFAVRHPLPLSPVRIGGDDAAGCVGSYCACVAERLYWREKMRRCEYEKQ